MRKFIGYLLISMPFLAVWGYTMYERGSIKEGTFAFLGALLITALIVGVVWLGIILLEPKD